MSDGFAPWGILSVFHNDYDNWGPGGMIDRSHWADKSSAVLNRERIADRLFDNFLDKCIQNLTLRYSTPLTWLLRLIVI